MTWSLIAHRSELEKPGDYVLLTAGAEQSLAYNHAGTVIVTDNICLHRGARVFSGLHGNAPLVCKYHGFRDDKALKAEALTAWVGDWLFYGDGSTTIEDDLGDLLPIISGISENVGKRHAFDLLNMPCSWDVAVENTLEDLHVRTVHPDTFLKLDLQLQAATRHGRNSMAAYKVGDERTVRHLSGMAKLFENVQPDTYFHILLWPYTCISSVGGFTFSVQHYLPSGGFTALHSRLYQGRTKASAPYLGYFFDEAVGFNRMTFQQDAEICQRVAGRGTYLTEAEQRVKWFREPA